MGQLQAEAPLPIGDSIGQVPPIVYEAENWLLGTASPNITGTPWVAEAGCTNFDADPWQNINAGCSWQEVFGSAAAMAFRNASVAVPVAQQPYIVVGEFSVDQDLSGFNGASQSVHTRYSITWTGGVARTDYVDFDPRSGRILGTGGSLQRVTIKAFSAIVYDATHVFPVEIICYRVLMETSANPAGTNLGTIRIHPSITQNGAQDLVYTGQWAVVRGSEGDPPFSPTTPNGTNFVGGTVLPQYVATPPYKQFEIAASQIIDPRVFNGAAAVVTTAGVTLRLPIPGVDTPLPSQTLTGMSICIVNRTNGTFNIASDNGGGTGYLYGPGFSAAGDQTVAMPTAATYPGVIAIFEFSNIANNPRWTLVASSVGPFTAAGVPWTPGPSAIVPAAGGAGTIIRSNGAAWAVSQSTYPDLIASGNVLFATAANTIGSSVALTFTAGNALAITNNAVAGGYIRFVGDAGNNFGIGVGSALGVTGSVGTTAAISLSNSNTGLFIADGATARLHLDATNSGYRFGTALGTMDAAFYRTGAAAVALGNGTAGNASGLLSLTTLIASGNIDAGSAASIRFTGRSSIQSSADGIFTLTNQAQNNINRINFGGNAATEPAIKRTSTTLEPRLADDSAGAQFLISANNSLLFSNQVNGAGVAAGTLLTAPSAGDPDFWVPCVVNGTNGWFPWWSA